MIFTVCGYIDCYTPSYYYSNLRTHVWGANFYEGTRGCCMYIREKAYKDTKFQSAKAGSVRCVVE